MAFSEHQKPPPIRSDLEVVPQYYAGELCYVVKDPVSATYFRLREVEYVVLQCFQRGMGAEETRREVHRKTGADISTREVHKFVQQLKASQLLKSKGMSDARRLAKQRKLLRRHKLKYFISNYLFVTIPVWDPDKVLDRLTPYVRFFFTPYFFFIWLALACAALWIVVDNFDVLLADAFSLLSGWNLLILSVVVFSIKFFHEMGHALTCKHFDGEVHAMGPAFLVFQPCMFTDTSDAWLLPSKWDRINVTAAGIVVELMLASAAAVVWVSSQPGILKQVAYTVMVASSISTILFNANPLLRFDGYYILADLLEIPNLRLRASRYLGYLFDRYLLGIAKTSPEERIDLRRILVTYGVSRFIYRMLLILTIGLFLYSLFRPLGLFMWLSSAYGMIAVPLWRRSKQLARQYSLGTVRIKFMLITALLFAAAAGLWFVPIRYSVEAPCVVAPARLEVVRLPVQGVIERVFVREGQEVSQGQQLALIRNPALIHLAEKTRQEIRAVELRLRNTLAHDAAAYAMELRNKRKLQEELEELENKIARLTVRAPIDGIVTNLHRQETRAPAPQHQFVQSPDRDTHLTLQQIEGAHLEAGSGLLGVTDVSRLTFEAFVYERDVSRLSPGLKMTCVLRRDPDRVTNTVVHTIVPVEVKRLKNVGITMADVGYIPVKPSPEGESEPLVTLYMVRAMHPGRHPRLKVGQTGKARITYGSGPMGPFYFRRAVRALKLRLQEVG